MWASLLSRPCTSSTAKLSVCREAVPFRAPFLLERSISPIRSAIVICCKTQLKSYIDLHVQLYPSTRLYWSTSNFQIVHMKKNHQHVVYYPWQQVSGLTRLFGACFPFLWPLCDSLDWGLVTGKPRHQQFAVGIDNWCLHLEWRKKQNKNKKNPTIKFILETTWPTWPSQALRTFIKITGCLTEDLIWSMLPWTLWLPWKETSWSEHPESNRRAALLCWSPVQMGMRRNF